MRLDLRLEPTSDPPVCVQEQLHGLEDQVAERDSELEKLQEQLVQLTEDFKYNLKVKPAVDQHQANLIDQLSLPCYGTCDQTCCLAEACKNLLLLPSCSS